jgi:PAS domain S-box-containing protein
MQHLSGQWQSLFEIIPAPVYIYSCGDFQFLAMNRAARDQYGFSETEFYDLKATCLRPPEEVQKFIRVNKKIRDGYVDAGRWKHLSKEGSSFYVNIFCHHIRFENRDAKLVVAVNIDNKVRVEQQLEDKISQVDHILESMTDGFYALDKNWNFSYVNSRFEQLLQCSRAEVIGRNIWDCFPAAKDLAFYRQYQICMEQRVAVHFEGCYSPLKVYGSVHAYPTKDGIAVFFTDITEQKKIQDKIARDEANLRAIINNTKDMIWSVDDAGQLICGNDAFWQRIYKLTGKQPLGIYQNDFPEGFYEQWQIYYQRALRGESFSVIHDYETEQREVNFTPMLNNRNEVTGVSCFSRDITELISHQRKIENQNEKLREIARLQSHELRNHVANIIGLVNLYEYETTEQKDADRSIELIKRCANNMDQMLHEMAAMTI